jgi:chromosome segregation ATPase
MSETPFQECQRVIRELRAELVEKDKLYVREMAKVATRDAEIERLQAICDPIISALKSAEAEIERLRQHILEMRPIEDVKARDDEIERLRTERDKWQSRHALCAMALAEEKALIREQQR